MQVRWLDYRQAAVRVGRDVGSIKRWHRQGLPMDWEDRDGDRVRVVSEDVLLAWFRDRLRNSPAHYGRMRKLAEAEGMPAPSRPEWMDIPRANQPTPRDPEKQHDEADVAADAVSVSAVAMSEAWARAGEAWRLKRGAQEFSALQVALEQETPACDGLPQFVDPGLADAEEQAIMAGICGGCPLLEACRAFADASRPAAGFWAGRPW